METYILTTQTMNNMLIEKGSVAARRTAHYKKWNGVQSVNFLFVFFLLLLTGPFHCRGGLVFPDIGSA